MRYDYNLPDIYQLLQPEGPSENIRIGALSDFVKKNGGNFTIEDERSVFKRATFEIDGELSYNDIKKILSPP